SLPLPESREVFLILLGFDVMDIAHLQ
ncbi:MAG: hypothetical protein QOJ16_3194, partial [Acidobacteriota bacterium]|nr:hypothetical protein [Acidobacteriota bacterium]